MKFAIQVNHGPHQSQASFTAREFIKAALARGQQVERVFFFRDGVYNGLLVNPFTAYQAIGAQAWAELAAGGAIDLVLCISAAERRGLGEGGGQLAAGFRVGGMGLWVEACTRADRLVNFGV